MCKESNSTVTMIGWQNKVWGVVWNFLYGSKVIEMMCKLWSMVYIYIYYQCMLCNIMVDVCLDSFNKT